jgi:lipopolysaccharide/colanic/teichoic acid biosynthesis glycosyltransferase
VPDRLDVQRDEAGTRRSRGRATSSAFGIRDRATNSATAPIPQAPATRAWWQNATKRGVDVVGALLALILLSPLLVAIMVAILVLDGRPVFFPWRVLGAGARPFTGYKFRTMVREAEAIRTSFVAANEMRGPVFKMRADPRVTRLGRRLRRYSLDELPQLWSVLIGDMSLVGPRPVYPHEYAAFSEAQRRKLSAKPGMTCLWQISGRNEIDDFDEWIRLDLQYIDHWSLRLDFAILLKTLPAVLSGRGAW